jgi:hypothetical protein
VVRDTGRDDDSFVGVEVRGLGSDPEAGVALEDDIDLIRNRVLSPVHLLVGLEADEVGDEARPVEDIEAVRPLRREAPGFVNSKSFHLS